MNVFLFPLALAILLAFSALLWLIVLNITWWLLFVPGTLILHLMSQAKRGILASIGLLIAVIGVVHHKL
jgi:hypothetical protein